jgi:hypothetical protein
MPRFGLVCDERVWRVPKLTNLSTVFFISAPLTGCTQARSFASLSDDWAKAGETADKATAASSK